MGIKRDISNIKFGKLLWVEDLTEKTSDNKILCKFKCDCGVFKNLPKSEVTKGKTRSCGCLKKRDRPKKDISGVQFNRLLWLADVKNGKSLFLCKCGKTKAIKRADVMSEDTKSCGCYHREYQNLKSTNAIKRNPLYQTWRGLFRRCYSPKCKDYYNYGGRGIHVSEEWNSLEQFCSDMGERPSIKHSLDRIDNDGPYSKENCRWSTASEQARNRQSNLIIEFNGEKKCLIEWAEYYNLSMRDTVKHLWLNSAGFSRDVLKQFGIRRK